MSGTALAAMAQKIRLPNDNGRTLNDFGVVKVAVNAGANIEQKLPADWSGRFIYVFADTGGVYPQIAAVVTSAAAASTGRTLDVTAAASASGATSLQAGAPIPPQQLVPFKLPEWDKGMQAGWLLADSAANTNLILVLAS